MGERLLDIELLRAASTPLLTEPGMFAYSNAAGDRVLHSVAKSVMGEEMRPEESSDSLRVVKRSYIVTKMAPYQ